MTNCVGLKMTAGNSQENQEIIEFLQQRRQRIVQQLEAETVALNAASGGEVIRRQDAWDAIARQLKDINDRLSDLTSPSQGDMAAAIQELIELLNAEFLAKDFENTIQPFMPAYHKALLGRTIRSDPSNITSLIQHLVIDLKESSPNRTLYRFVRYLIELSIDQELPIRAVAKLKEWEKDNIPESELTAIKAEVEREQAERSKQESCLLIKVYSSGIDEYHIKAWHIPDRKNYRQNWPEGAKPVQVVEGETDATQTKSAEELEPDSRREKIGKPPYPAVKIKTVIQQIHQQCCQVYEAPALVEVFLPQSLMNTDIDSWRLQEENELPLFGTRYPVILRSSDRLTKRYWRRREQKSKWEAVERLLRSSAKSAFRDGDPSDVIELQLQGEEYSDLDNPEAQDAVGLKLMQPSSVAGEGLNDLFETVLMQSALPLMIWARQSEVDLECSTSIDQVLSCLLERLPKDLKSHRLEAFRKKQKKQGCHIGNHLSLLWDDPQLIPPDSE
jgi:vWA-MoxR associated protein C-terminal domain/vWA-MoxR associated protein middle region (VMAP-M) 1